jgi:FMN phosphatase YigB (HAD superfamily)
MIKGIICDLDGAYFVHGKENFVKNVSEKYKVATSDVKTMFFSSESVMEYKRGKIHDDDYWKEFIQKLKLNTTKESLINTLIDGYEQDERVVNLIKGLKEKNFQTILCSNNFPARVEGLNRKFNFLENFTVTVFSYNVGKLKLEGFSMFDEVIKKSNLNKEEILIFDNGTENIAHAKAYGFAAIWYENYLQLMEELENLGIEI